MCLTNSWGYLKMADEVLEELWKVKDAMAYEHGYDVRALAAHLRALKHGDDTKVVDLRTVTQTVE